jgi:hypothetical protein
VLLDDVASAPAIASVTLLDDTTVRLELSGDPADTARVGYAAVGPPGAPAGPSTGARGCLRDSDTTTGSDGVKLPNWAVHFDEPIAPRER